MIWEQCCWTYFFVYQLICWMKKSCNFKVVYRVWICCFRENILRFVYVVKIVGEYGILWLLYEVMRNIYPMIQFRDLRKHFLLKLNDFTNSFNEILWFTRHFFLQVVKKLCENLLRVQCERTFLNARFYWKTLTFIKKFFVIGRIFWKET